jgi:superfamily II DNA/RNA helicase
VLAGPGRPRQIVTDSNLPHRPGRSRPRRRTSTPAAAASGASGTRAALAAALDVPAAVTPADVPFADLGVPAALVTALAGRGLTTAFPIQVATLPESLTGRDVIGRGKTGSGKTLAFAIPVVAALLNAGGRAAPRAPRALILVPTRELALQVDQTVTPLAAAAGLSTTVIFGGVPQSRQVTALNTGIDIVIACPGRLDDLIGQGLCHLDQVKVTVLDEADHMADLGFLPVVRRLLDKTTAGTQRLLFSATLDGGIGVLVDRYLNKPAIHSVDAADAPPAKMTHHVLNVDPADKAAVVRHLAAGPGRRVLFTRTKHGAKGLARKLNAAGIPAVDLHGNLAQNARERNLAAFHSGTARVLVATDIAARGIHVDDVTLVVHVDPPAEHKAYLHRSGRTARAGAEGVVVTVMTPDQAADVKVLARQAGINPTYTTVTPGHELITDLSGVQEPPAPQTGAAEPTRPAAPSPDAAVPAGRARRPVKPRRPHPSGVTPARPGRTEPVVSETGWATPPQAAPARRDVRTRRPA